MKKILLCAVALVSSALMCEVYAAPVPYVEFSLGSNTTTHTYTAQSKEEAVSNVSTLFDLRGVKEGVNKSETLKIKSVTKGGDKVAVSLRLEIDEADPQAQVSVLDYYDFVITDNSGEIVYSSAENEPSEIGAVHKDMPVAVFNTQFTTDSRTYKVEYGINEETASLIESVKARAVRVKLVTNTELPQESETPAPIEGETVTQEPLPAPTAEAVASSASTTKPVPALTPIPVPSEAVVASASPAPSATPSPTPTATPIVKKVCGKDIAPGTYYVTGNGVVTITNKDGVDRVKKVVADLKNAEKGDTSSFKVDIEEGDVITVVPLEGMEKASIAFEVQKDEKAAAKTADKADAKKNTKTATKADEKTTAKEAQKTNPKTGDAGLALGVLGTLMGVSAVSVAGLGVLKKKKK